MSAPNVPVSPGLSPDIEWLRHAATTYRALAGEMVTDKARAVVSDDAARFERIAGELEAGEKARHKAALLSRTVDRYVPCQDHRDKVNGDCYVCALERAHRERDAACADAARWRELKGHGYAASFADEQFPGDVVLKFAFPPETRMSADLNATIDAVRGAP